jgi:branched-chain amino acid transport system ATP-binding protein
MSTSSAIVARGLQKKFGAVTAAADLQIEIAHGARVSLIGSNGAGKTTFVNMLTGYIKPDAGEILLDGRSIVGLAPRQIARLGVARSFQIPQLYKYLSVQDNLLAAIAAQQSALSFWRPAHHSESVAHAHEILQRFDLLVACRSTGERAAGWRA